MYIVADFNIFMVSFIFQEPATPLPPPHTPLFTPSNQMEAVKAPYDSSAIGGGGSGPLPPLAQLQSISSQETSDGLTADDYQPRGSKLFERRRKS